MSLSEAQNKRYERQLVIPEIGSEGQEKLLASRVFIMGTGGLGSAAALYLAAAGVGTLGLADDDRVELSNLQRQIIHDMSSVDMSKTESAAKKVKALNPDVKVELYQQRITYENVMDIINNYDLAVECSDNFSTKYLMNDACYFAKKTLCFGGVIRMDGQATTFKTQAGGPCYRCLFPTPAPGVLPTPKEAGILGTVAGLIGLIQATEALKEILGIGNSLTGRLIYYDAMNLDFEYFQYGKNEDCPLCGSRPRITGLVHTPESG
jgi:molybdopterin/thiamine biosynthesis adenylyltransferase